ncbi:MAG: hypothetical protein M3T96_08600 [Acidobacteriota bacterium]|nr:hypothetical protein [Acidobacteriota bacterium]
MINLPLSRRSLTVGGRIAVVEVARRNAVKDRWLNGGLRYNRIAVVESLALICGQRPLA